MNHDTQHPHVLFVDGVCVLCHGLVSFLMKIDRRKVLRFSTLQGETAQRVLHGTPHDQERERVLTVIYIRHCDSPGQTIHLRSTAALLALRDIGGIWRGISWLRIIPRPIRDFAYNSITKYRYKMFGKHTDACPLPSHDQIERTLP